MKEYQKTDISKISSLLDLKENNFIAIFNEYYSQLDDDKFNNLSEKEDFKDENIFKSEEKINKENLNGASNDSQPHSVIINENGSIEIKNNNYSYDKENRGNISEFNGGEDNILINNINNNININNDLNIVNGIKKSPMINKNQKINEDIKIKSSNKKYKKTDVSKVLKNLDIIKIEKFNKMLDYVQNKIDLNIDNIDNIDNFNSANVRLNLDSDYKNKRNQLFPAIPEEDNESYDSLSLQKSMRSNSKATPNLQEIKKKSINDNFDLDINNNLIKTFSKDKSDLNLNKNNNFMIEEINIGEEEDKNNNSKDKIKIIDLNFKTGDKKDTNYTTPESKEKTIEKIYENIKNINEERNSNSGPKEFSPSENDEKIFSDFIPNFNDNESKENIDINNKENINIINNNIINNNINSVLCKEIKINKSMKKDKFKDEYLKFIVTDRKNKIILFLCDKEKIRNNNNDDNKFKIPYNSYFRILQLCFKIKPTQNKIYENFIKKLFKKLPNNIENISINSNEFAIHNYKIETDIKRLENEINYLKDCYLYLIVKKSKLKSKKDIIKLDRDLDVSKKKEDIEKLLDNLLFYLKENEKQNYFFYISAIRDLLNRYHIIQENEISEAKIKEEQDKLTYPFRDDKFNSFKNMIFDKIKDNFLSFLIFILPFLFIYIYFNNQSKNCY